MRPRLALLALLASIALVGSDARAQEARRIAFCGEQVASDATSVHCSSLECTPAGLDLTPLAGLSRLERVSIPYGCVTHLEPLAGLPRLREVELRLGTAVSLAPLAGKPLRDLSLVSRNDAGTDVLDLSGLGPQPQLAFFTASASDLRGGAVVGGALALEVLTLSAASIDAMPSLARHARLRELELGVASLTDLSSLRGVVGLRVLRVHRAGSVLRDLRGLETATALEELTLRDVPVQDLAPVRGLGALRILDLTGTQVRDLAPIAGAARLERLRLDRTPVESLAPLAGLRALRAIEIDGCSELRSLDPLGRMTWLREISAAGLADRLCEAIGALRAALPAATIAPACG